MSEMDKYVQQTQDTMKIDMVDKKFVRHEV